MTQQTEIQQLGSRIRDGGKGFGLRINRALTRTLQSCDERGAAREVDVADQILVGAQIPSQAQTKRSSTGGTTVWGTAAFELEVTTDEAPLGGTILKVRGTKGGVKLPLRCTWRRRYGQHEMPVHHTEDSYPVTADDVGSRLVLEALGPGISQPAFAELGPFEVELGLKRQLHELSSTGELELPVKLRLGVERSSTGREVGAANEAVVKVTETTLRVQVRTDGSWSEEQGSPVRFGDTLPRASSIGGLAVRLCLSDANIIVVDCTSASQRDLLIMSVRLMRGRVLLSQDALIELVTRQHVLSLTNVQLKRAVEGAVVRGQPDRTDATGGGASNGDVAFPADLLANVAAYREQLDDQAGVLSRARRDLEAVMKEKDALNEDLENTVQTYNRVIDKLNKKLATQDSTLKTRDIELTTDGNSDKVTRLKEELARQTELTKQYHEELRILGNEVTRVKGKYKEALQMGDRTRITQQGNDDQAKELKKLEREKGKILDEYKRLKENFLYTKETLDEVRRKFQESEKTRMDLTTKTESGEAALKRRIAQLETLNAELSTTEEALRQENTKLKNKVRVLAHA